MPVFEDLTGQRFERLSVIKRVADSKWKDVMYFCKCECGGDIVTRGSNLRNGSSQSCGCLNKENQLLQAKRNTKDLTGQRFDKFHFLYSFEYLPMSVQLRQYLSLHSLTFTWTCSPTKREGLS